MMKVQTKKKNLPRTGKVTSQMAVLTSTDCSLTSGIGHQEDEGEWG